MTTNFPELTGSPKQIAWAADVRPQVWAEIERFALEFTAHVETGEANGRVPAERTAARREGLALALELARTTAEAKSWIDVRNATGGQALWTLTMNGWKATARWQSDPAKKHAMLAISDFLR